MRSKVVKMLVLALLLCGAGVVLAQQPNQPQGQPQQQKQQRQPPQQQGQPGESGEKQPFRLQVKEKQAAPEKSKLEEMLTEALKNNPDIRVAAAKLAEAEAKLNRTRVEVTQKVVALYHAIRSQQAVVDIAQRKLDNTKSLQAQRAVSQNEVDQVSSELTIAKAKLEELQVQLPALLGKVQKSASAAMDVSPTFGFLLHYDVDGKQDLLLLQEAGPAASFLRTLKVEQAKVNVPQAEKLRKALQTPIKVDYKNITFDEILKDLSKKVEGLSFRNLFEREGIMIGRSLCFDEALPVSAILQALSDETGCLFFVRDYGIVAISDKHAPKGAMTVEDFLRQKPAEEARPQSRGGKNPPAENVEGLVKSVDASGLLTISIGSDAGLTKGNTLQLYRLNPSSPAQSKYLGTVRILEVEANQSVAQPVGRLSSPPQAGDRVASRILGK